MSFTPLSLALLAAGTAQAMAETTFDQDQGRPAGEKLYDAECRRCHAPDSEHASYGPPLNNVIGRGAGTVEGYDYSIALEASGIVWTPRPCGRGWRITTGFMPGTKMRHVGIEDRTVQDFILAYLDSITTQDNSAISD